MIGIITIFIERAIIMAKRGPLSEVKDLPEQSSPKRISPPTYDEFLQSCENGNIEEVGYAIEYLTPEVIVSNENRAFRWAVRNGHLAVVNRLLEINAVKEDAAAKENDALSWAIGNNHLYLVIRLLEVETVRNSAAACKNYFLRDAASHGYLAILNRLLEIDTVRDNASINNNAPLCWAAYHGHLAVVNRLLEIDVVRNNAVASNNAALRWAIQNGHLAVVKCLLKVEVVRIEAIRYLKLNFGADENVDQQINILINRFAEQNPKLMKSIRNEDMDNQMRYCENLQ